MTHKCKSLRCIKMGYLLLARKCKHFCAPYQETELWKHKIFEDFANYSLVKKCFCNCLCFISKIKIYFTDRHLSSTFFEIARNLSFSCFFFLIPLFVLVKFLASLLKEDARIYGELERTFLDDVGLLQLLQAPQSYMQTYGGIIIGISVLVWIYFSFLKNFEHSINQIWKTETRKRPTFFWHSLLIILFISGLVLVTLYMSIHTQDYITAESVKLLVSFIYQWFFWAISLYAIYKYFPISKIKSDSFLLVISVVLGLLLTGLSAGAGAIVEMLLQKQNKIYGTPLVFAWLFLYIYSLIVLIGAYISYYHLEKDTLSLEIRFRFMTQKERNRMKASLQRRLRATKNKPIESLKETARNIGLPYSKACEISRDYKEINDSIQIIHVKYGDIKIYT